MNFNLKKFSKTQLFIWITLLASIIWIFWPFLFSNWDEIEFNSATEHGNINNQKWNNNVVVNTIETGWNVTITENIVNNITENKIPTKIEEEKEKQWDECKMVFDAFIRRLNRSDYSWAYKMLDKHMKRVDFFSVDSLKIFKESFVKTDLEIWSFDRKSTANSDFVARCEFHFNLRYLNRIDDKDRIEMWKWVVLKNKDEVNYFEIGELKCLDKKCENNPLFDIQ